MKNLRACQALTAMSVVEVTLVSNDTPQEIGSLQAQRRPPSGMVLWPKAPSDRHVKVWTIKPNETQRKDMGTARSHRIRPPPCQSTHARQMTTESPMIMLVKKSASIGTPNGARRSFVFETLSSNARSGKSINMLYTWVMNQAAFMAHKLVDDANRTSVTASMTMAAKVRNPRDNCSFVAYTKRPRYVAHHTLSQMIPTIPCMYILPM